MNLPTLRHSSASAAVSEGNSAVVLRPHSRAARRTCTFVVWIQTSLSSRVEAATLTRFFRSDSGPVERTRRENPRVREDTLVALSVAIERADGACATEYMRRSK